MRCARSRSASSSGRGGIVVALDQRGPRAGARDQAFVQCPHGRRHRRVVAVDEQRVAQLRVGMVAREVDFGDGLHRKGVEVVGARVPRLCALMYTLFTSSSRPQPVRRTSSARKSVSVPVVAVEVQVMRGVLDGDGAAQGILRAGRCWPRCVPAPRACAGKAAGPGGSARARPTRPGARTPVRARCAAPVAPGAAGAPRRAAHRPPATATRRAATPGGAPGWLRARPGAGRRRPGSSRGAPPTTGRWRCSAGPRHSAGA
jgi:hypothetical protein